MKQCLCGSGRSFDECCKPIIDGAPAPTAETLMRSRYSAYALGNTDYLATTLSSDLSDEFDQVEADGNASDAKWLGLEIKSVSGGGEDDEIGEIEFIARFQLHGQQRVHHELSQFSREDGRWVCSGGEMNPKSPPRQSTKIGRNEPCPCGSGKKYKKCCGA
ncbi:MAG: YchJ family protein [Rhodospirillaceae bacterium]|nr:YchJ family protein [Rhodospirillaceae bacterium]